MLKRLNHPGAPIITFLTACCQWKQTACGPTPPGSPSPWPQLVRTEAEIGQGCLDADQWPSMAWRAGLFPNRENWAYPLISLSLSGFCFLSLRKAREKFLMAPGPDVKGYEVDCRPGMDLPIK